MLPNFTRGPIVQVDFGGWPYDDEPLPNQAEQGTLASASQDCADCLLDVNGAAELLGVSPKWVYVNYATLPYIPIGSGTRPRLRFRRKALLDWIDRREIDWRKQ